MRKVPAKNDVFRNHILSEITIGIYREGERLPGERELGERYQVSRNTIRRALQELENAGIVCRRPPVGTFVADTALQKLAAVRESRDSLKVAFLLNPDQMENPEFQLIFNTLHARLQDEAELVVYFSDDCARVLPPDETIDAAILFGGYPADEIAELRRQVRRIVLWGRKSDTYNYICCDNYAGGRRMAEAAIQAGHRHLALIGPRGDREDCEFSRRADGIRDVCAENRVALSSHRMTLEESMNLTGSTYLALDNFLRSDPAISAVLALYDRNALAVIDCCRRRNLKVPEEISVIGFDDQCYSEFIQPPLTTIRNVATEVGARLAEYIEAVLRTPDGDPVLREEITPFLIERATLRRIAAPATVATSEITEKELSFVPDHALHAESRQHREYLILFKGNSITRHGTNPEIKQRLGWDQTNGMAASSETNDYAHLFAERVRRALPGREVRIVFGSPDDANAAEERAWHPSLVVFQSGEHSLPEDQSSAEFERSYRRTVAALKEFPPETEIIAIGVWAPTDNLPYSGKSRQLLDLQQRICRENRLPLVSVEAYAADPGCRGAGEHAGVRWHPNDRGMAGYAEVLFAEWSKGRRSGDF